MSRQAAEAGVCERGPPLAQVVHEEVADRAAGQVVPVDELLGRPLTEMGSAEHPHCRRGLGREDADGVEHLIEVRALAASATLIVMVGQLQQLNAVADRDVADPAALGGQDDRDPVQRAPGGDPAYYALAAGGLQGGEPLRVTDPCHLVRDAPDRPGGQQPGNARADDIAAGQHQQPRRDDRVDVRPVSGGPARPLQPLHGNVLPARVGPPAGIHAAGDPALLPRPPRLCLQPVQEPEQGEPSRVLGHRPVNRERRCEQARQYRPPFLTCGVPGVRCGTRGEPRPQGCCLRGEPSLSGRRAAARQHARVHCRSPNKIPRLSGR